MISRFYRVASMATNLVRYKDPFFFRGIALEISTYCNRSCYYCPNAHTRPPKEFMSEEVFYKAVERLQEIGYTGNIMYHFYNEPLLDSRLPLFSRHIQKNLPGCLQRLVTNGDYLTMEIAEEMIAAGVAEIQVTIHDKNGERLRRKLQPIADRYPYIVELRMIHDQPLSNRGGAIEVANQERLVTCTHTEVPVIDHLGRVVLCCNDFYRQQTFGSIMEKRLDEIWKDVHYHQLRRELRAGDAKLPLCRSCLGLE